MRPSKNKGTRWQAVAVVRGQKSSLGTFATKPEAEAAGSTPRPRSAGALEAPR